MLGLVPGFFEALPRPLLDSEWESFRSIELSGRTAIPNKYKELIGIAVSGATRCRYCAYSTRWPHGCSAPTTRRDQRSRADGQAHDGLEYLPEHASQYDSERFTDEVDRIAAYLREQAAAPV